MVTPFRIVSNWSDSLGDRIRVLDSVPIGIIDVGKRVSYDSFPGGCAHSPIELGGNVLGRVILDQGGRFPVNHSVIKIADEMPDPAGAGKVTAVPVNSVFSTTRFLIDTIKVREFAVVDPLPKVCS